MEISWVNRKLKAQKSSVAGTGVFALKAISKGECVAVFGGFVVEITKLKTLAQNNKKIHQTILDIGYQIDDKLIFSPTDPSQFSDIEYLNHSCEPNCGFTDKITLVAMRDIVKGEELSMDYAGCISTSHFEMECSCGAPTCRKFISKNDWQNPRLQKKYGKHFQPYLLEKIKRMKNK